eukprot:CAMPEP_0170548520 /NCGR_PEP_ID=MMETSP0211-20121228/6824_1 /TAXON_ID=311385 /ORGANISM="Pseudokeronopsis sp., Strain OXSARD2" /LENGTH=39 /DNA_ID= /DNA_START= /DNA_END= /DNA_ORIENTATION=
MALINIPGGSNELDGSKVSKLFVWGSNDNQQLGMDNSRE